MDQGRLSFVGTTSEFMRLYPGASFEEAFIKAVGAHA
jgi:hypothetical protein